MAPILYFRTWPKNFRHFRTISSHGRLQLQVERSAFSRPPFPIFEGLASRLLHSLIPRPPTFFVLWFAFIVPYTAPLIDIL